MHSATEAILKFFEYSHLPPHLQEISKSFHDLAHHFAKMETEHGAELTAGLRKLLEAKDCIVRAGLTHKTPSTERLLTMIMRVRAAGYIGEEKPCNIYVIAQILKQAQRGSGAEVTEAEIRSALDRVGIPVVDGIFQESDLVRVMEAGGLAVGTPTEVS